MKWSELEKVNVIEKVKIHSLMPNLYQVSVIIAGEEFYLEDSKGRHISRPNKIELQQMFEGMNVGQTVLCHQSAYDEMVGQPMGTGNVLEVPLGMPFK